jgi:23S rRNA pseudouridine2605 synthase
MRLNRFLARAGVASRRGSDELIQSGAVRVNGEVAADPGRQILIGQDRIEVGSRPVVLPERFEYIALHKPAGCLVTRRDPQARPTVFERIPGLHPGTVAVGRLDLDTTGLLLLTDDGELAFRLMHPRFGIDKRYEVVVRGRPAEAALDRLRRGVELEDGVTAPAQVEVQRVAAAAWGVETQLTIAIHEGRKRQIRRMFRTVGHPVRALKRVVFAGLELDLPGPGQWRRLTAEEVRQLRDRAGLPG